MKHFKIIFCLCLVTVVLFSITFAERTERPTSVVEGRKIEQNKAQTTNLSPISPVVIDDKVAPQNISLSSQPANFILVTDILDGFGGQKYGGGCDLSIFAGGQSSAIGTGSSTNYKLSAGFIYPVVVQCGDANGDGIVNAGDVVYLVSYLYRGGPTPKPYQAGETNCDGIVNAGDVVKLVSYLYRGGDPPIC